MSDKDSSSSSSASSRKEKPKPKMEENDIEGEESPEEEDEEPEESSSSESGKVSKSAEKPKKPKGKEKIVDSESESDNEAPSSSDDKKETSEKIQSEPAKKKPATSGSAGANYTTTEEEVKVPTGCCNWRARKRAEEAKKKLEAQAKLKTLHYDEHKMSFTELSKLYHTSLNEENARDSQGLTSKQAAELLAKNGPNRISPPKQMPEFVKFLRHLINPLIILLLVSGILSCVAYGLDTTCADLSSVTFSFVD